MDQRATFRFPTDVEADVRSCNRSWPSRLCNVSIGGCMITCEDPAPCQGTMLRLRIKGLTAIDGTIAWVHRGHAGIRFVSDLHPAVMEHIAFRGREEALTGDAASPPVLPDSAGRLNGGLVKRGLAVNDEIGLDRTA